MFIYPRLVFALAISNGVIYAGGIFGNVNVAPGQVSHVRGRLAAFLADAGAGGNGVATEWNPDVNGTVEALAVNRDTIYAGGFFSRVNVTTGSQPRRNLAAFDNVNGTVRSEWDPSADNDVHAIAVSGSNTVYVGGIFTRLHDDARAKFGAIDAQSGEIIP